MDQDKEILFTADDGEEISFSVIAETMIAGVNYLLVAETAAQDQDEADAYIMMETGEDEQDKTYEFVDDDHKLSALSKVFGELLDDIDIEL